MATNPAAATPNEVNRSANRPDGLAAENPLTAELSTFMQSGVSIILGSADRDGFPIPRMAHGCRVDGSGSVRLTVGAQSAALLVEAVKDRRPVAATFTRAEDHRSIQIKANSAQVKEPEPADIAEAGRQTAIFADKLATYLFDRQFSEAYVGFFADELVVIEFMPGQAFVQTPGPGAGAALK